MGYLCPVSVADARSPPKAEELGSTPAPDTASSECDGIARKFPKLEELVRLQ